MITELSNSPLSVNWQRDHACRYLEARYGKSVWFLAPETFSNVLERWIWAVANNLPVVAEACIVDIESRLGSTDDGCEK
jgi:hypothetical protein